MLNIERPIARQSSITICLRHPVYCISILLSHVYRASQKITHDPRQTLNNYWMRSSRIWGIIKAEVCVICRSRRLRQITQTEGLRIPHILREPNSIIVLLFICICEPFPWKSHLYLEISINSISHLYFAFGISSIN